MSSLPTQPYQVSDFAGGLTDNFIGGGATRYMSADNFLVTVDRKLEERYGSQILSTANYQLPSGNAPVDALISHDVEQFLLGVSVPNLYVLNPTWQSLLGPTGNPPLSGGAGTNDVSWGEWSHHTLITDDSLVSVPTKIYRGGPYVGLFGLPFPTPFTPSQSFQAVTAGLPPLSQSGTQNINNSVLLALCITLAVSLQTEMLAHFLDYGATLGTNLHQAYDSTSYNYINGLSAPIDQTTLENFIIALMNAFGNHINDVTALSVHVIHFNPANAAGLIMPLNFVLSQTVNSFVLSTSYATAPMVVLAAMLDELKTKFFMHQMAPFTHDNLNNYAVTGRYLVTTPHIGTVSSLPILNPSITQSLALANGLKTLFDIHALVNTQHIRPDTVDQISFPPAVDLDTLYIMIALINAQYFNHFLDSYQVYWSVTATLATSGNEITNVLYAGQSSGPPAPPNGWTIWDPAGSAFPQSSQPVTVASTSPGVINPSVAPLVAGTLYPLGLTASKYHVGSTTTPAEETTGELIGQQYFPPTTQYSPTQSNLANWVALLVQITEAYLNHDNNATIHITAGLWQLKNLGGSTPTYPVIASYAYAMHWFYQYMRYDGVIFQVVGPVTYLGPIQTEAVSPPYVETTSSGQTAVKVPASTLTITNIPELQNDSLFSYDVDNIQVALFRTINAGSTYYQFDLQNNGTSQVTDTIADAVTAYTIGSSVLNTNQVIYTSGGVLNYDPPPACKYITILNNTAYFGAVVSSGQTFLNRVQQSVQNNIDAAPGSFYIDMPDIVTGLSATRNNLIVFCQNSIYQVSGLFTPQGQGQMVYQDISDTIGCVSGSSIVKTDVGIFFAGTDGFYYTDGFQIIKLSSEFNLTYQGLVSSTAQKHAIYGCYDRYNRRVWWSVQANASSLSVSKSYVFHVNYGVTANGVFTTASNGDSYRPTSMIFFQGQQIRGDERGYLFLHTVLSKTDPQVNISTSPTTWNTLVIPYNYSSCALDFGTTFNRKWFTRITLQGKNVGNVGAQITSISDNGRVPGLPLSPLLFTPNIAWGFPNIVWGAPNSVQPIVWGGQPEMDMWRRFPATQLRADFKQIMITPATVGVYRYQDWPVGAGAVITPSGTGTASIAIQSPSPFTAIVWPSDVVGYTFSQQGDGYVAEYAITSVSGATLVVSDPNNVLTSSTVAWIIRGVLKEQRLSITSYAIHFTLLGKMQQAYQGIQDSGENAPGTKM